MRGPDAGRRISLKENHFRGDLRRLGRKGRTVWQLASDSIIESLELLQLDVSGEQLPAKATRELELAAAGPWPSEQKLGIIMGRGMA